MRYRWLAVLLLTLMLTLTGCQSAVPSHTAVGIDKGGSEQQSRTVIRVLVPRTDAALAAQVAAFSADHPNYQVNLVPAVGSSGGQVAAMADLIRRQQVDLVYVTRIEEMTQQNLLADLTPYLQKNGLDLKPYGGLLESMTIKGKLFDLPVFLQPQVLAYNRELLATANVTAPTGPWTWDDLRRAAQAAKRGEGDAKIWGFDPTLVEEVAELWLTQKSGGNAANAADLQADIAFFAAMTADGSMPVPARRTWGSGIIDQPTRWLLSGKAAFGMVDLDSLTSSPSRKRYGLAYMPASGTSKPVATTDVSSFGLAATAQNPDAAWEFLRFITGPEGAKVAAKHGALPAYRTPEVVQAWLGQPAPLANSEMLFEARFALQPRVAGNNSGPIALYNLFNQTLSGASAVDTAVADYLRQGTQGPNAP